MGAKSSKNNNDKDTSMSSNTFKGLGRLITVLPTGTVFAFQFLNPIFTNNGRCGTLLNKDLTAALLVICAFNCVFTSFTDSYTGSDGCRHYGVVTTKGIWPAPASDSVDMKAYRLRFGDFVHALFALLVFAVLALLDNNTVHCFYPKFETQQKLLLQVLSPVVGAISGGVFVMFPNNRHGIGYPASPDDNVTGGGSSKSSSIDAQGQSNSQGRTTFQGQSNSQGRTTFQGQSNSQGRTTFQEQSNIQPSLQLGPYFEDSQNPWGGLFSQDPPTTWIDLFSQDPYPQYCSQKMSVENDNKYSSYED